MKYGNAPEDNAPAQEPGVEVPQEMVRGAEITFPQFNFPKNIKRAVARLHVNLGHPTSTDLVRMLRFRAPSLCRRLLRQRSCAAQAARG